MESPSWEAPGLALVEDLSVTMKNKVMREYEQLWAQLLESFVKSKINERKDTYWSVERRPSLGQQDVECPFY